MRDGAPLTPALSPLGRGSRAVRVASNEFPSHRPKEMYGNLSPNGVWEHNCR
jgi:hypothetical protein